jgi:hypothetical protein
VTLTNTGTATLSGIGMAAGGGFAETNTCGSSLVAGAQCTISVTFAPAIVGPYSGTVAIDDNAGSGTQFVMLSGTGTLPATPPGNSLVQVNAIDPPDEHVLDIQVIVQ